MTKSERAILRLALGREARLRSDARICVRCNRVVEGQDLQHCGEWTREFRSKYLRRFPRERPKTAPPIPESVVNREYRVGGYVRFVSGGQFESDRRRH
jgi:hypothetical protein